MKSAKLKKEFGGKGFQALPRGTIQAINNADALAIWTLLMSMPDAWIVRKKWVKSKLNIGDIRYRNGTRCLRDLGLWKIERIRNADGTLGGSKIIIYAEITSLATKPEGEIPRAQDMSKARKTEESKINITYEIENNKKQLIDIPAAPVRVNHLQGQTELEQIIGVQYPPELSQLKAPQRVASIIFKSKITTEAARVVFAEFAACYTRKVINDPWALLSSLTRKAASANLRLSAEGEKRLSPFV